MQDFAETPARMDDHEPSNVRTPVTGPARPPQLGDELKVERRRRRLSLREVSYATGVSVNTLSRVERGHLPDLKNYQRIIDWLGVPADMFLDADQQDTPSTPEVIARHLRADSRLDESAVNQLTTLIQNMYSQLVNERPRVAAHMRSAKTFTPAAGTLLAEILAEMQHTLEAEIT